MAVSNVQRLTRGDRKYAAKKQAKTVPEVTFDADARKDFITGFHKRKLARQAEGRRKAEELNRQARLAERRRIREDRQKSISKGMERLEDAERIIEGKIAPAAEPAADTDDEEFKGFDESSGILKRRDVAYGNSNVTFEEVNLDPYVDMGRSEEVLDESTLKAHEYATYVQSVEDQQRQAQEQQRRAQKKRKFRYLPKRERQQQNRKNRR